MKTLLLTLITSLLLPTFPAPSLAADRILSDGFDSGNAGDAIGAEFLYSARDLLQRFELLDSKGEKLVEVGKLRRAIETTVVVSEERVFLNGMERDAVNYPEQKLIKVNRTRWKELRQPVETKARLTLVLHEFLWILKIDDTNYSVSAPLIEKLSISPYSPGIWLDVPGLPFATAECTGKVNRGTYVTVRVATKGATKTPHQGEVIIEREGNRFGYRFSPEAIAQFFERDEAKKNLAMVGLSAFIGGESPVQINYAGKNYVDQDAKLVLDDLTAMPSDQMENSMLIWKGPGFSSAEVWKMNQVVCSVLSNN
jgi:hypothetical protein